MIRLGEQQHTLGPAHHGLLDGNEDLPVVLVRSRALGRSFVLARDPSAFGDVSGPLPVVYFGETSGIAAGKVGELLRRRAREGPAIWIALVTARCNTTQ